MPWSAIASGNGLGTQLTTLRVAVSSISDGTSFRISTFENGTPETHINSPFYRGLVAIDAYGRPYAVGANPDFSVMPKWRKVVRQIG